MKKIISLVMAIALCLTSFAFAEDRLANEDQIRKEITEEALQAEANGEGTLSVRIAYIVIASEITGKELNAYGYELDKVPVITVNKENYAFDACEAHIEEVRSAVPKRINYGEEIANALLPYNFFACVAGDITDYSGENDISLVLTSQYAYAVKADDTVMMVICIPDGVNGYDYVLVEGKGLGENRVEFVIPAETARRLPTDAPALFDFFAK